MQSKDGLIINLSVDWRLLVLVTVAAGVLAFGQFAVNAQDGEPPNTNSVEPQAAESLPEADPAVVPNPPSGQSGDLIPTTNDEWISPDEIGPSSSDHTGAASTTAVGDGRHFYLTDANFATNTALTACAGGYHMASLWEILDVSNLTYDYDHPDAHVKTDSGFGPPSYWNGWVRTGWSSSGAATTGTGNCQNWSSSANSDYGVSVRLSRTWETAPGDIFTWDATSFTCSIIGPVWCVRD